MNADKTSAQLISATQIRPATSGPTVLPELSCTIRSGEINCLLGLHHSMIEPYLHVLAGIEPPASGTIQLMEYSAPDEIKEPSLLRQKIGFVLQGGPLLSVINGVENLKLAARYHQLGDEETLDEKAQKLLAEMPHKKDHMALPAYMSKLLRRHIAIARPLMLDPEVLILDNPFEGLSYYDKDVVAKFIVKMTIKLKIALIISTDDLSFTQQYANQIIFFEQDRTQVFNRWQSLSQCQSEDLKLLFKYQNMDQYA